MFCYKLIGLFALIGICASQKVQVRIYYESLCPDSRAFITEQVFPAMKTGLKDNVNLIWIPYGKSHTMSLSGEYNFTCHHGPNECYGNKIHSCAIEHIQGTSYETDHTKESLTLDYINCLMASATNFPDSMYPGEKCARETKLRNWHAIEDCANSTEGNVLLNKNGQLTDQLKPSLSNVPTVTFNFLNEPEVQKLALSNFRSAVCKHLSQPTKDCASPNGASTIMLAPLIAVLSFLLSRFI